MQMARKFEMLPASAFENVVNGAGIILTSFNPSSPDTVARSSILCATDGGVNITITPEYVDMADGIDNCPSNTKQLKRLKQYTITMSGTAKTVNEGMIHKLIGPCDAAESATTTAETLTFTATRPIADNDFHTLWFVGDYGDVDGSFIAVKLENALNSGGFSMQTADGDKASFSFNFTAHYDIDSTGTAPFTLYLYTKLSSGASLG